MGCDIHLIVQHKNTNNIWECVDYPETMEDRNYNIFAVLANVRNGTWGEEITPISEPKGLPEDLDIKTLPKDKYEPEEPTWLGDHSYSYITLKELLDYNWNAPVKLTPYVYKEIAAKLDGKTMPECYSAWSSNGVKIEVNPKVKDIIHNWDEQYIPWLITLGEPNNVRLVFGFDS